MIPLWMALSLALAADVAPEESADESVETELVGPERSSPPAVIPADPIDLDEPTLHELPGGTKVWHVQVPGVRKVEVGVVVYGGSYDLDEWPTALATYSMDMADIATGTHTAEELEILSDIHDISLYSWMSHHSGGVNLSVPLEDLELGLKLTANLLIDPAFPKKDVQQYIRDELLWYAVHGPTSLGSVSWQALNHAWQPADHIYGARPDLTKIKKVKWKDLAPKQDAWRTSGPVGVVVVGDVDWATVEPFLAPALEGLGTDGARSERLEETPRKTRVVAVDMPGQAQSALRLRYAAPMRSHEDRVAFYAMNWAFGGHFLSRLNANLREDKGFTYGSRSSYSGGDKAGTLTVSVDVKAENTAAAITEIQGEFARLVADGVTAEELDMAYQAQVSRWNGTRETAGDAMSFYGQLMRHEETVADRRARVAAAGELDSAAIQKVAQTWFDDQPHTWVIVGDRSAIQSQLEGLDWDVEWISPNQAILGAF